MVYVHIDQIIDMEREKQRKYVPLSVPVSSPIYIPIPDSPGTCIDISDISSGNSDDSDLGSRVIIIDR
ncbi:hypothetical protein HOD05_05355 [Candidatus Woesearchaeota archaeon]|jgi:hypothetical protein|nr:hypothetical protein [Candidatus Woesearchaeota archaeon]MBT4150522.1 hypothetical protein [Candidatus Woesearchaeota archaeon]MBT4247163.1 hypothetical protein [Candidatus Woesearchaeota archaeon]MBT4434612.1 hypothetical protein [Candidatus Woesearchaeota archaeon]MBT7332537.1 hypothetical protein [Candidatus Woesearchaeota archaeon]